MKDLPHGAAAGLFRMAADLVHEPHSWGDLAFVCDPASTGATRLAALSVIQRPGKGDPFHLHPAQDELAFVISGRVEFWLDRERRILGPGDSAYAPAGVVHAAFDAGGGEARLLAVFGPAAEGGAVRVEKAAEAPWSTLRG